MLDYIMVFPVDTNDLCFRFIYYCFRNNGDDLFSLKSINEIAMLIYLTEKQPCLKLALLEREQDVSNGSQTAFKLKTLSSSKISF